MISTKIVTGLHEVPTEWIFERYCSLSEKLSGQDIKMKSLFNPGESNPSFCIYWNGKVGRYMFNDFSTGHKGTAVELVRLLFDLRSKDEATTRIIEDYERFIQDGEYRFPEMRLQGRYRVIDFKKRGWNVLDKRYWTKYGITSTILEKYNVVPLESYLMRRDGTGEEINICRHYIYGYFDKEGTLYKIYQPTILQKKFLKVKSYIQGSDQLTFTSPILVICASLKDALCLLKTGWNLEVVAPDSENTLIPQEKIEYYKEVYPIVCTLLDNDKSGLLAMKKYKEIYALPYIQLSMEKDIADAVKTHGITKVRRRLAGVFKESLNFDMYG